MTFFKSNKSRINVLTRLLPKSFPKGEAVEDDDPGDPRLESEAKLLKTCKGDAIKDVLKLGVDGFFFEAEGGGEFSSAPKFSLR